MTDITGALTNYRFIVFSTTPAGKTWLVRNSTTGGYPIYFDNPSLLSQVGPINPGETIEIFCDGTNIGDIDTALTGDVIGPTNANTISDTAPVEKIFNVKHYGALGNGIADDAGAIAATIIAATAVSGTVYFPAGTYLSSTVQNVPAAVSVKGNDMNFTSILFYNVNNGFVWSSPSFNAPSGIFSDLTISGIGTGLTGLTVHRTDRATVRRCVVAGWTQQGIFFEDTNLTQFMNCKVYACGSSTFGQVEIDGYGWGSGGGSTNFMWLRCISEAGNSGCLTALRIDRSTNVRILGGSCENAGTPIIVSGKVVSDTAGQGTNEIIIDGLDIEDPTGAAVSFIDFGYGLPASPTAATCAFPKVINCEFFAQPSTLPVKAIRFRNTYTSYVGGCTIGQGSSSVVAGIWYEGTTNHNQSVGVNLPDNNANPYVAVNGVVQAAAVWSSPWMVNGGTYAVGATSYSDSNINGGVSTSSNGVTMVVQSQGGYTVGDTNSGDIILATGIPNGAGTSGVVKLEQLTGGPSAPYLTFFPTEIQPHADIVMTLGSNPSHRFNTLALYDGIYAGTNSGPTGHDLTIRPELGTVSSGNVIGGNLVIDLQVPQGTGLSTESHVEITRGGSTAIAFGPYPTVPTTYSAAWMGLNGSAPTIGNLLFYGTPGTLAVQGNLYANNFFPNGDLAYTVGALTDRWSILYLQGGIVSGTSTTGAGATFSITAEAAKVGSTTAGGILSLSGGARDGATQLGYVEVLVPSVATPLMSWGNSPNVSAISANHQVGATQGTNTSQIGTSRTVRAYKQTTTNAAGQNIVDIDLPANGSHIVHVCYVIRKNGGFPSVMAAGELAACMWTDNTKATLIGSSHAIWSEDGTGGDFATIPVIIANGSQLKAGVNVSPGSNTTYDYEITAWSDSN